MSEQDAVQEGISLNDLILTVKIIDTCTKRGAFEGGEMATVGQLRNKLETFVKVNAPPEEETSEETSEE